MKKLMVLVVLLAVALIAAPAIAQNESTNPDPPSGGAPGDGPGAPFLKASQEPPLPKETPPEAPAPELPAPEIPAPEIPAPEDPAPETPADDGAPVSDSGDDGTSPGPGNDVTSTDIGSGVGEGPSGSTRDDAVEDAGKGKANDEVTKDEIADDDEVDAEDREDRIADRILADLKDGKKDKDKDDDNDNADEDGVEQNTDQDADSGDVDQDVDVINTGDNVNQCVAVLQIANTGNAQNQIGVVQSDSEADDIELEDGSTINITPRLVLKCKQVIRQVVRSERLKDSDAKKLTTLLRPRGGTQIVRTGNTPNRVGGVQNRVGAGAVVPTNRLGAAAAPKVLSASRAGQPKASTLKSLPRTGGFSGYATLLGLGTGILLVGGGLLVRRLAR